MTDYIIVLAVAIMVFSIASLFIFARGKLAEDDQNKKTGTIKHNASREESSNPSQSDE